MTPEKFTDILMFSFFLMMFVLGRSKEPNKKRGLGDTAGMLLLGIIVRAMSGRK